MTGPKKEPRVRPGQKKPFRKSAHEQVHERIEIVEMLLGRHLKKHAIHDYMRKKHDVEWRQCDRYMACARENLLERLRQNKESHRCQSLALYEEILKIGTPREKILAQERIDKLLGLEQPRALNIGGVDGAAPIKIADGTKYDPRKLSVEKLIQLKSILEDSRNEKAESQP